MEKASKDIIKTKDRIIKLLQKYPNYRDYDEKLTAHIWRDQLMEQEYNPDTLPAIEFLKIYASGSLTSSDCITRTRALIQSQVPELQGSLYKERKSSGKIIKAEIHRV